MLWIGLTGGLGTGKSTVAKILRQKGHLVVDADEMARLALDPAGKILTKVLDRFGAGMLGSDGNLDRSKLAAVVFADRALLTELEKLVHPEVRRLTLEHRRRGEAEGREIAFYDVPLLFEKNMAGDFSKTVVVVADPELQIT